MANDDDTAGDGGPLSENLFQLAQQRSAEALAELGPAVAPRSGIGLGTVPPGLAALLGDRPLSPAERGVMYACAAIEAYREAGKGETADAIDKAIAPKRGRGRPPEWSDHDRFHLAIAAGEELRADPTLSGSDACAAVAERPEWQGWSGAALQKQVSLFAKRNGLSFKEAINKLRGSTKSGH